MIELVGTIANLQIGVMNAYASGLFDVERLPAGV